MSSTPEAALHADKHMLHLVHTLPYQFTTICTSTIFFSFSFFNLLIILLLFLDWVDVSHCKVYLPRINIARSELYTSLMSFHHIRNIFIRKIVPN